MSKTVLCRENASAVIEDAQLVVPFIAKELTGTSNKFLLLGERYCALNRLAGLPFQAAKELDSHVAAELVGLRYILGFVLRYYEEVLTKNNEILKSVRCLNSISSELLALHPTLAIHYGF